MSGVGPAARAGAPSIERGSARFGVVVPVKPRDVAKSRLAPLGDARRRQLAAAMALDTVAAAVACDLVGAVLVVTDDAALADDAAASGARVLPDAAGRLNDALLQGAAALLTEAPVLMPTALCGDLPALRATDLAAVLQAALASFRHVGRPVFVPDAAGHGTTLYVAPGLARFAPRFGPHSRDAHLAQGCVEITGDDLPGGAGSVRQDVDTPQDLRVAEVLGLGPRTLGALAGGPPG